MTRLGTQNPENRGSVVRQRRGGCDLRAMRITARLALWLKLTLVASMAVLPAGSD